MDNETRAAIEKLTKVVETGFGQINDRIGESEQSTESKLATIEERMQKGFGAINGRIEAGFAAVADDIADTATKEHVSELHTQINSIEAQLRGMKFTKLESRIADLEEEVLGESRA